ncbi:MAG: hypothetical protein WCP45_18270 [Verrucomicrobiota bacterium]
MKFLLLTFTCACVISCERHEFEGNDGTRQLHESHAAHDTKPGTAAAHDADHRR